MQNKTLLSNLGEIYCFIHIYAFGIILANIDIVVNLILCNCHEKKRLWWLIIVHVTLMGLFLMGPLACGICTISSRSHTSDVCEDFLDSHLTVSSFHTCF